MYLNQLMGVQGRTHKRAGRGPGSKLGGTSGRGENGANSRTSRGKRTAQGGQTSVWKKLPKFGFTHMKKKHIVTISSTLLYSRNDKVEHVNIDALQGLVHRKSVKKAFYIRVIGSSLPSHIKYIEAHYFSQGMLQHLQEQNIVFKVISYK